jgi:hypothetical protein
VEPVSAKYQDIINLPHHVSKTRLQMAMSDRAAQFAPFAALTGYDDAVKETGRLTDDKIELEESAYHAPLRPAARSFKATVSEK